MDGHSAPTFLLRVNGEGVRVGVPPEGQGEKDPGSRFSGESERTVMFGENGRCAEAKRESL